MALAVRVPARWQARVPPRVTRRDQRVDKKRSSSSARATRGSPSSPGEADASDEASAPASASAPSCFFAGVGVGDCTGPMDGVGMMGYARVSQISSGLRQRQKARAFVVAETRPSFLDRVVRTCTTYADDAVLKKNEEVDKNDGHDPTNASTSNKSIVALVVVDACMVFPDLKAVVARRVAERIEIEFGLEPRDAAAVFDQNNLCVCATHTHSAPGGYAPHGLYNVTFGGAVSESFDALARGAAEALFEAFADAFRAETKTRTVGFARGELVGVSANRSRSAFDLNPEIETAPFACSGGVDETVSALVIGSSSKIENRVRGANAGFEAPRGVAAWYAVHGTSLPGSNTLISGDNKGIASSLTESALRSAVAGDDSAVRALEALFRRVRETNGKPETETKTRKPRARGLANADVVASAASAAARVVTSGFERRSSECQSDVLSTPSIVAAFPQSASGDVSPNVLGAFDARAGTACDGSRAERDGGSAGRFAKKKPRVRDCVGRGPPGTEGDRFLSCLVTGTAQAAACVSLLDGAARVSGPVRAAARWVPIGREGGAAAAGDLPGDRAAAADRTATPALGYSFAAGTTDGPGENGFTQGDREHEDDTTAHEKKTKNKQRFLGRVATFLFGGAFGVSKETRVAHAPKPVLVAFRDADEDETETRFPFWKRRFRRNPPLGWVQRDVQVQVFRIGRVLILSVPAEVTTVAGKRLEDAAARAARRSDPESRGSGEEQTWSTVVNGLANGYSGYVTTAEEYAAQRYEGASTLYGPNTLRLYERVVAELVAELVAEREDEAEDETEDETESSYARAEPSEVYEDFRKSFRDESVQSLVPPFDTRWPPGTKFGEVVLGPNGKRHSETDSGKRHDEIKMCVRVGAGGDDGEARVSFLAGRPRRLSARPRDVGTHVLVVERFDARLREWHVIADDDDVSTIVEWDAHGPLWLASRLTLSWRPPEGTKPGTYRVGVAGAARTVSSALASFLGKSRRRAGLETPEDESLEFFRGFSEPFEVLAGKGGE